VSPAIARETRREDVAGEPMCPPRVHATDEKTKANMKMERTSSVEFLHDIMHSTCSMLRYGSTTGSPDNVLVLS
jgi:hypothetical protein